MARGSVSPFEIVLSGQERRELERRAALLHGFVRAGGEGQDRVDGGRGNGERRDCCPARYQPAGGPPLA